VLSLDDTLRPCAEVTSQSTPNGCVLVDLRSGNCFELNRVGHLAWAELAVTRPLAQVCESLLRALDVQREVLERDVVALFEELQRAGLVEPVRQASAAR
jgi:hypothetical protein